MNISLLPDIVLILGFSLLTLLVFIKLKLPSILGFLIAGVLLGPYGLNMVHSENEIEVLAEIGVILLLFVIGIEFSLKGLRVIKNIVLLGGSVQVFGTIAIVFGAAFGLGIPWNSALFLGFLFSLSSTAIVLKMLQERGEISASHGRIALGILIFQDIIVVLLMLVTPMLAGSSSNPVLDLGILVAKMTAVVVFVILAARYAVPYLLRKVVETRNRELFIITIVVLCFATAWLTSVAGLSLALGAFFAGLVISESEYGHQAAGIVLPFREVFISFFFVSIGMLLNTYFLIDELPMILLLTLAVVIFKLIIVVISVLVLGYPFKTALHSGLILFQVGEFAFLLSSIGMEYQLLTSEQYQYFLSVSIVSMAATPFVMAKSDNWATWFSLQFLPNVVRQRLQGSRAKNEHQEVEKFDDLHDHLVIIGYGINGKNVAMAAQFADVPYVIVELNPKTVEKEKEKGEPIVFGDASDPVILKHVCAQKARVVVVAISSPTATQRIVSNLRSYSESVHIIVRTRYLSEIEELTRLGADQVIPEEFETSLEIFAQVLTTYLIPNQEIERLVQQVRDANYQMLRGGVSGKALSLDGIPLSLPAVEVAALRVLSGSNKIIGKTLAESDIRKNYEVTVLAIKRKDEYLTGVGPNDCVKLDDVLVVFGKKSDILKLEQDLSPSNAITLH